MRESDPTAKLSAPRRSRKLPRVLGLAEVQRLLDQPKGTDPMALRDRALLELMYACGLRASETIDLDVAHVDLVDCVVRARGQGVEGAASCRSAAPPRARWPTTCAAGGRTSSDRALKRACS